MITRHDMLEPLLDALPAFRPAWQAFVAHWQDNPHNIKDDPRDLPTYLFLADLAAALCDLLEAGRDDEVRKAFAVCERWIVEGDDYVSNAAIAGLLEDTENAASRRGIDPGRIAPLLGPRGRRWWEMETRTGAYAPELAPPPPVLALSLPADVERRLEEKARSAGRVRGSYAREIPLSLVGSGKRRSPGEA